LAKAESVAMQNCAQHAKDCQVTVWYDHKCGAVAADQGPTAFWVIGNTIGQARTAAPNECMKAAEKVALCKFRSVRTNDLQYRPSLGFLQSDSKPVTGRNGACIKSGHSSPIR
jgi:hypothetical protein